MDVVCGILALLFIAVPVGEIYILLEVGGMLGLVPTLGIIVVTAVVGAYLARHQGLAALREMQRAMATGEKVGRSIIEAALVLVAGVTMLTPGFFTDAVGLLLLVPPVRRLVAGWIASRAVASGGGGPTIIMGGQGPFGPFGGPMPGQTGPDDTDDEDPPPPGVIDV
jgi:UPF0716 protein FxsA